MKKISAVILAISVIILLFVFPSEAKKGVFDAIRLSGEILIPSLFPFMAISLFISKTGLPSAVAHRFGKLISPIFGCDDIMLLILSFAAGYPVGAKLIADKYKRREICKETAEFYLTFLVNAGPAFIITAVGCGVLGNTQIGVIIFTSCLLGSFMNSLVFRRILSVKTQKSPKTELFQGGLIENFVSSVSDTTVGMITLTGFVSIFSCIYNIVNKLFYFDGATPYIAQIFEVTTGVIMSRGSSAASIAAGISFGGLSVVFQVLYAVREVPIRKWVVILSRLSHAFFSFVFVSLLLKIFPVSMKVFWSSGSPFVHESYTFTMCITLMLLACVLICSMQNRHLHHEEM